MSKVDEFEQWFNETVPKKPDDVSEEEWINYLINVWCGNSLNAMGGYYLKQEDVRDKRIGVLLLRAQSVISYLVYQMKSKNP